MPHHNDDHHAHQPGEGASRAMVLFSLALFFAMTVVGHYVFVASAHHESAPATGGAHQSEQHHDAH